jgi:predicted nucleic acid-binding protein
LAEFHAVLHRRIREGFLSRAQASDIAFRFSEHARDGLWSFVPVSEALLRRTGVLMMAAPAEVFLRTADAVHLVTAQELGEREIWTSVRRMLAAAPYFGLVGRIV